MVTGGGGGPGGSSSAVQASPGPSASPTASPSSAEPAPAGPVESESPPPATTPPEPETGGPPPAEEKEPVEPQTLAGVVVHVNPAAGSYALAESGGALDAVHAGKAPARGDPGEGPRQAARQWDVRRGRQAGEDR